MRREALEFAEEASLSLVLIQLCWSLITDTAHLQSGPRLKQAASCYMEQGLEQTKTLQQCKSVPT